MSTFKQTYLYIKQHTVTGVLYFGKTTQMGKAFGRYIGGGRYWNNHLRKHGKEHVETLWYCLFTDRDELVKFATMCSDQWDIVNAKNENGKKIWANEKPENGLDGGFTEEFRFSGPQSDKSNKKRSKTLLGVNTWTKGRTWSEEERKTHKRKGSDNGFFGKTHDEKSLSKMSDDWKITTPAGESFIVTNLEEFCRQNNLNANALRMVSRGERNHHKGHGCINLTQKRANQ